jgi:hypothetical protein
MAKELAMVERNEMGRKIRKYFIQKEKEWRQLRDRPVSYFADHSLVQKVLEQNQQLMSQNQQLQSSLLEIVDSNQRVMLEVVRFLNGERAFDSDKDVKKRPN